MGPFFGGFSEFELKKQLNLATHRFQVSIDKRSASVRKQKQEIASMLAEKPYPKEEKARIRAEGLIREDNAVEAMEILQLTCKTLHEHIRLLSNQKECPSDHVLSVSTLIWASKRFEDVPELQKIISQFRSKYGKKFVEAAIMNAGGICDERVVGKLITDATTPSILVQVRASRNAKK
jgi:vacuolar protein sorting-associated protein IST1